MHRTTINTLRISKSEKTVLEQTLPGTSHPEAGSDRAVSLYFKLLGILKSASIELAAQTPLSRPRRKPLRLVIPKPPQTLTSMSSTPRVVFLKPRFPTDTMAWSMVSWNEGFLPSVSGATSSDLILEILLKSGVLTSGSCEVSQPRIANNIDSKIKMRTLTTSGPHSHYTHTLPHPPSLRCTKTSACPKPRSGSVRRRGRSGGRRLRP